MGTVIAVVALLFLVFMGLGAYVTVKAVGAAKRGVDRTLDQARRTVEDTTLKARTLAQPGPVGELAQLRLGLRTSMRATQDALQARVQEDESLKESLGLFERLSVHGHELDDELKRLERDPDRARLTERMPELRERTRRITESAESLRWAARDRARRFADDDLDGLSAQIDLEAGALRHWTTEPAPEPGRPGQHPGQPGRQGEPEESGRRSAGSAASSAAWPEPPAPEGAGAQTWPDQPGAAPQEPTRPAITPPGRRPTFAWQKKPRPENTT